MTHTMSRRGRARRMAIAVGMAAVLPFSVTACADDEPVEDEIVEEEEPLEDE